MSAAEETEDRPSAFASAEVSSQKTVRRVLLALARLGIGLGLLVYLVESGVINLHALVRLLISWPFVVAAGALFLCDMALMAWRLSLLFRPHDLRLSFGSAFRLTMVGQFFSAFLPGGAGGDVVKLYYAARENHGRRAEIVTIVLFDRAVGLFSLLLLSLLIAPFFLSLIGSNAILGDLMIVAAGCTLALLAAGALAISGFAARHPFVSRLVERAPGGAVVRRMMETLRSYRHRMGTLAAAVALGLAGNLAAVVSTMIIGVLMNPGGLAWRMGFLIPLGDIANSLPLTPGGLGVGEAAFGALFSLGGSARGADILLGWRLVTAVVGLLGLLFYLQGLRRVVSGTAPSTSGTPATLLE